MIYYLTICLAIVATALFFMWARASIKLSHARDEIQAERYGRMMAEADRAMWENRYKALKERRDKGV